RTRLPPTRSGDAGRDRPPSLPRPPTPDRRGDAGDPPRHRQIASTPRPRADARRTRCGFAGRPGHRGGPSGMTTDDTFGQHLSAWLHEEAGHRVPDHLSEVLVQTAATRQRKWWTSPERWLPVDTATDMRGRIAAPRS